MQSLQPLINPAKWATRVLFSIAVTIALTPGQAQPEGSREQEFRAVFDQFLAAVHANDKTKMVDLIEFPVSAWAVQSKGNVQEIAISNKADFLSKYDSFFTASMRSHAIKTKPQKISDDHYAVIWHDTDLEYSFEFEDKPTH